MTKAVVFTLILMSTSSTLFGQVKQIIEQGQPWVYEFQLEPAAEVEPSLRYRLLPDSISRQPGNAALSYYRALQLFQSHAEKDRQEFSACEEFWLMIRPASTGRDAKPVETVPIDRVKSVVANYRDVLDELHMATHLTDCDWGPSFRHTDAFQSMKLQFPEFYALRQLARLTQMQARVAIKECDYDQAFEAIQMGFQLSRRCAECPFIIPSLVGIAISIEMHVVIMELEATPHSPNIYWALANAPVPFVDVRGSVENELNLLQKFPLIRDAETSHSPEEWQKRLSEIATFIKTLKGTDQNSEGATNSEDNFLGSLSKEYSRAMAELVEFGYDQKRVDSMPITQVFALHESKLIRFKCDNLLKLISLPFPEAISRIHAAGPQPIRDEPKSDRPSDRKEVIPLFHLLCPAVGSTLTAAVRLDRCFVRAQLIEALRQYAAQHEGQFPSSLGDIQDIRLPVDPITGKQVIYKLEGETAVMEFPSPNTVPSLGYLVRLNIQK